MMVRESPVKTIIMLDRPIQFSTIILNISTLKISSNGFITSLSVILHWQNLKWLVKVSKSEIFMDWQFLKEMRRQMAEKVFL